MGSESNNPSAAISTDRLSARPNRNNRAVLTSGKGEDEGSEETKHESTNIKWM